MTTDRFGWIRPLLLLALLVACIAFLVSPANAQTATVPFVGAPVQFLDNNGVMASGGKLCTYAAGTTTPLATYTDSTGGTPNANPVILDSSGRAKIWLGTAAYKFVLLTAGTDSTCSTGVQLWTVDNVTGANSLYVRKDGANSPIAGNLTFSGNNTHTGPETFSILNGIRFADQYAAGSSTGGIQEAHDALPSTGGIILLPPNYTATVTATINISKPGVCVVGSGMSSVINVNFSGNVFNVTGDNSCLKDFMASYAYTLTRSGSAFIVAAANVGLVQNIHIGGNATTPTNGTFFYQSGTKGAWIFRDLFLFEGAITWDTFATIQNNSGSVTAASYFFYNVVGGGKFLTAGILLDGALDTIQFTGGALDGLTGTSGPTVWVRNTVAGFIDPRWIHFTAFSVEAVGQIAVEIDNVRDFQFDKYVASANTGVAIGAGAVGVNIHDTTFINIAQSAITVAAVAAFTNIHNNFFDDTANSANNTYDTISVAANATAFTIIGNSWRNINGINHPRYGINLLGGTTSAFQIIGNEATASNAFATAFLNDPTTTLNKNVFGNGGPFSSQTTIGAPNSPLVAPAGTAAAPSILFSTDSSTGLYQLSSGNMEFASGGSASILWVSSIQRFGSGGILGMSSNANPTLAASDVNLSRKAAGTLQIGTGETANASGNLAANVGTFNGGVQAGASGSTIAQDLNCGGAITPASVNATTCAEQTFTIAACSGLATTDTIFVNQSTANTTLAYPVGDWRVSSAGVIARTYCNPTAGALTPVAQTLKIWALH